MQSIRKLTAFKGTVSIEEEEKSDAAESIRCVAP